MPPSALRLAADVVVVVHLAFVIFVMLGSLLMLRWRRVVWLHAPAAIWGIALELGGWVCPLTPLENHLRACSGSGAYEGDFIEHYIMPLLYPVSLTREAQILLGCLAIAVNATLYWIVLKARIQVFAPRGS